MKLPILGRRLHRWGAVLTLLPALLIFTTGTILQVKKQVSWVQPPTARGSSTELALGWEEILDAVRAVEEAQVESWDDIDRLDVRPSKGMLKVRCKNRWEVQLDSKTGAVLQSAYRRSDLLESLHDGSWFHDGAKLYVWFPTGLVLCGLWASGAYLWVLPYWKRRRRA